MRTKLLTNVVADLVNKKEKNNEYGVTIINLPDFDYCGFVNKLNCVKRIELFFIGFPETREREIIKELPNREKVKVSFSVENAEESRNTGDEGVFRVMIVKRVEVEKLSSLRWYSEITLENVYNQSCSFTIEQLSNTNAAILSLIKALQRKSIRNILNFERVLDYLEDLLDVEPDGLPYLVVFLLYRLGLCSDKNILIDNPNTDECVKRIKHNHDIVEKIRNLEQAERQSITNYYASQDDNTIPSLILEYYKTNSIQCLRKMDLEAVEDCLKAVKKNNNKQVKPKGQTTNPTVYASQLVFNDSVDQIEPALTQIGQEIDSRTDKNKAERVDISIDGEKIQIKTNPISEMIASDYIDVDDFGGVIYADVDSPTDALEDNKVKYSYDSFTKGYLDGVLTNLARISSLLPEGESISGALKAFLAAREELIQFKKRLQDVPMLQVLAEQEKFSTYLNSYERLLTVINEEFSKIWSLSPSNSKQIVSTLLLLDNIFIVGRDKCHAIPTPLNPLYLWKYIRLAEEIIVGRSLSSSEPGFLSEKDKEFIINKAEDIPDPLTLMLLPGTIREEGPLYLPLSGRIGLIPVYSTKQQINQSESGIEDLQRTVIRYICLYPHSTMMLRIAFIDPPSVETVIAMIKALNSDKEFDVEGIEVSIFRTKEATSDWIEIDDESLNSGLLGRIKGNRSLSIQLNIANKKLSYDDVLNSIASEQHIVVLFDPNEVKLETVNNNKQIHIHPLCVPKIYQYNFIDEKVVIRPTNEGSIFSTYSSILEKLNEHPSTFSHTSSFFNTPLKRETYDSLLSKTDWLVIFDHSLKSWDLSLQTASEKLFYRENDARSMGIYSKNSNKFVLGYDILIKQCGNYMPNTEGLKTIISNVRAINNDGLLSIVSHTTNRIFEPSHGKGSLGLAITAIKYKQLHNNAFVVGLDTQLAHEWLSDRDEKKLPDLVGITFSSETEAKIDIIEVKTYANNDGSFRIVDEGYIVGDAVKQVSVLEELIHEIFGSSEKITTVSRKEILREQVFDCLLQSSIEPPKKYRLSEWLNNLFAGKCKVEVNKIISFVDFDNPASSVRSLKGRDEFDGNLYCLSTIGSKEIQNIISGKPVTDLFIESSGLDETENEEQKKESDSTSTQTTSEQVQTEVVKTKEDSISRHNVQSIALIEESADCPVSEEEPVVEPSEEIREKCTRLNKVLRDFNIQVFSIEPSLVQETSRFTRFKVRLKSGESIRNVERRKDDIGIQLEASGEILVEHIKSTNLISIDIPFETSPKPIKLIDNLYRLENSKGELDVLAGQTPDGSFEIMDLAKAPHLLVAGTTGSGKTIFLYSIIISLLKKHSCDSLQLLIIDPKQTDFTLFDDLPILYGNHVVTDANEALSMIQEINDIEKEKRTELLRTNRCRDIGSYNSKNPNSPMKRLVIIIDEYADLIQAAEMQGTRKGFENLLKMLAQRVRNLGIHIVIATQRPSAQIVTGDLKINIPQRVSFKLPSHIDSQTILDMSGAENLLGKGDMLLITEDGASKRLQGAFVTEDELEAFLDECFS